MIACKRFTMLLLRVVMTSLLLLSCALSHAEDDYFVSRVFDGDTVELKNAHNKFKLRLSDIDAPERNQAYGQKARRALSNLCKGSSIEIQYSLVGMDKYNRQLGRLQCNRTDASLYLAEHGYAWFNEKYSNDISIRNAANAARMNRIGLWNAQDPTPPWTWRRLQQNNYSPTR